jgi:chromosome partitioning protein
MKVLTLASSKGGVGKTTLAFNLAIHAARSGLSVYLADVDPQRSLANLCIRRREQPELQADNPMLLSGLKTVAAAVADLADSGHSRDWLIVDTPASLMTVLGEAISAADVIVMPLQASPLDYLAQDAVVDLVNAAGRRNRLLCVLNRVDPRSPLVAQTAKSVAKLTPHKPLRVAQRLDYPRALLTARAAVETNKDAAGEIAALWAAVLRLSKGRA